MISAEHKDEAARKKASDIMIRVQRVRDQCCAAAAFRFHSWLIRGYPSCILSCGQSFFGELQKRPELMQSVYHLVVQYYQHVSCDESAPLRIRSGSAVVARRVCLCATWTA